MDMHNIPTWFWIGLGALALFWLYTNGYLDNLKGPSGGGKSLLGKTPSRPATPWDGQTITLCIKDNKVETIFAGKLEPPPPGPPEPGMVPVKISGWIKEGDVKPVPAAPAAQPGGK